MNSIATRLNIGFAISWVVLFVVLGVAVTWVFRSLTEFYVTSRLEHDAESLLVAVDYTRRGNASYLKLVRLNPIFDQPYSGHYFRVMAGANTIESRSLWDYSLSDIPSVKAGEVRLDHMPGPETQALLVRTAGYLKGNTLIQVSVAEDVSPMRDRAMQLRSLYILSGIVLLVLMMIWQRLALRKGLRPLQEAADELKLLEAGEQEQLNEDVSVEIKPFVVQLNQLIKAMKQRMERSRQSIGNLAHALKTPLTRLNQLVEGEESVVDGEQRSEVQSLLKRMQLQIDSELKRARMVGRVAARTRVDLNALLKDLIQVLEKIHNSKSLEFRLDGEDDCKVLADPEDMAELFGNLLDNAAKWANTCVVIKVAQDANGQVVVSIEDDGPGVAEEQLGQLFQRGVRLDEKQNAGHGLGLSIVDAVVQQYGGQITTGRSSALGGLRVEVSIRI